ncbi:MAG: hypothetical protein ACPG1A_17805, partial [Halioglobus sp.]
GYVCNQWPADSPRCHEQFLSYVEGGALAAVIAVLVLVLELCLAREQTCAVASGRPMGETGDTSTYHNCVWNVCGMVGWHRTRWCCGMSVSKDELIRYDRAVLSLNLTEGRAARMNLRMML